MNKRFNPVSPFSGQRVHNQPGAFRGANNHPGVSDAETPVAVVLSPHHLASLDVATVHPVDARTAPDPEAGPDLGLLLAVDSQGVVGRGRTLVVPLGTRFVSAHAGIHDHPLSLER